MASVARRVRVPEGVVSRAPPPRCAWKSSPGSGLNTAPATASHSPGRVGSPVTTATDTAYAGMP